MTPGELLAQRSPIPAGPSMKLTAGRQLALAVAVGLLATLLWRLGALATFDLPLGDQLLRLPPRGDAAESAVAVVTIDDAAVAAFGALPWPRHRLARLVDHAFDAGARGVAVDVILSESSAGDAALAQALRRGPVALAAVLRPDGGWLLPLADFGGPAVAAHAEAAIGPDGVVRGVPATKQRGGVALPALALAAARLHRPELPITPGALLRPAFRRSPGRLPHVDASRLLGRGGAPELRGRVVVLGVSAAGAGDRFPLPTDRNRPSPGAFLHAATAAAILDGELLRDVAPFEVLVLATLAAGAAQAVRSRAGRLRLAHFALALAILGVLAVVLLRGFEMLMPVATVGLAFGGSALLREVVESATAQRETGELLAELGAELPGGAVVPPPRGSADRLRLARRLQEGVLRDRELRRTLLDALEDGVVLWDAGGRPVMANAAVERLWGGLPQRADVEPLDAAEATPSLVRRGGRELRVTAHRNGDGLLGVLRDVTAERQLEERRRQMQRLVSHELKTPLASLAGFGGMLERYELSREELRRVAGLVRGESEKLLAMVVTFLDLERLGSGGSEADRGPVDLAAVARDRAGVLRAAAERRAQRLDVVAPTPAWVLGNAELLGRVVDNLVGNAVKYGPEGSRIELLVTGGGAGEVRLEVCDEGPGIPPEARQRLFERFFRVPGTPGAGSGLGLALVREIAHWHGGEVALDSAVGAGSRFVLSVPRLREVRSA